MESPRHQRISRSKRFLCAGIGLFVLVPVVSRLSAQSDLRSVKIADSIVQSGTQSDSSWSEETGLELQGLDAAWYNTAKGEYFRFVKAKVDAVLAANGSTGAVGSNASNLFARQLLLLYRVRLDPQYYKAASAIRAALAESCDASAASGDSICTAEPFLAEYASVFQEKQEFANITRQFERWDRVTRTSKPKTDAGPLTDSDSAHLAAALVDALPYYPSDDPGRTGLIASLTRIASAPHAPENPAERCLLTYAIAKGVRLGYLPERDSEIASSFGKSIGTRAGDKGNAGALLLAAVELDLAPTATLARGQTVVIDAWFNSQQRKNAADQMESFHYKWSDMADSGYALLGNLFRSYGAATDTLFAEPTKAALSKAQYYVIASPDIPVKNPNPHYMTDADADEIAAWVKAGGVLVMMENDPPNADIAHLNLLADRFSLHFDDVLHHHILGEQVEDGRILVDGGGPLFHQQHTLYMKDTCAISLHAPAVALLRDRGDVVMASAKYGRGTVFAAVDPWVYNEYTDGRKKPEIYNQFDNFAGGRELVQWLLQQHPR